VPTSEGAAFAARTGCLFVEASAKTAVGVTEAFNDVVTRIIDTPSLWNEEKSKSSGRTTAAANSNTIAASGPRRDTAERMPGNIDLSQVQDEDASAGCLC
jgi:Ras-related protein Rab-18